MKRTRSVHIALLFLIMNVVQIARAQDTLEFQALSKGHIYRESASLRELPQTAFKEGERLVFDVGYSFITAGEAVMSVPKIDTLFGRPAFQVLFTVNSTKTFSWIYKVDDRYETFLDVQGMFPWHFTQRVREGSYSRDFEAWFDQINNVAFANNKQYPIPPYVHDAVSAFYFVRTLDYSRSRVGEKIMLQNFFKDTTYSLSVKFLGRQRIEVDAGTFDCIIVEPLMREGGLFKSEGRVLIWLTDDERKIPVKVSTKVVIGSIDSELREYSGINGPIRAKVR
ncbi:MAG: DUF3108 domain-containing protein [Ignavibacteriales bacterium]|nr:DUF3108 domain-containing protein [Ignavibacteriales bacterium]